jgi:hypothetical protein
MANQPGIECLLLVGGLVEDFARSTHQTNEISREINSDALQSLPETVLSCFKVTELTLGER